MLEGGGMKINQVSVLEAVVAPPFLRSNACVSVFLSSVFFYIKKVLDLEPRETTESKRGIESARAREK